MKKILVLLLVLVLGFVGWRYFFEKEVVEETPEEAVAEQQPSEVVPVLPDPEGTITAIPEDSEEEPVAVVSVGDAIVLDEPVEAASVTSPFVISGKAKASGKIFVRILNVAGKELISETANLLGPDSEGYSKFRLTLIYEFANTRDGFVEIYTKDESGNTKDSKKVALKFQ